MARNDGPKPTPRPHGQDRPPRDARPPRGDDSGGRKPGKDPESGWRILFPRQKSSIFYRPAKYLAMLMLLLTAAVSLIPYAGKLAWLVPFAFVFMERDSRFLALVSAQTGFWAFLRGLVIVGMDLVRQILIRRAYRSRSRAAIIAALTNTGWHTAAVVIDIAYYVILLLFLIMAWYYYAVRVPGLWRLSRRFVDRLLPPKR